jgi:hypothetical protein
MIQGKNKQAGRGDNEHKTLQRLHWFKLKEPQDLLLLLQQSWIKTLSGAFI